MVKDISTLNKCPACGSDNVKYMRKEDQLVCNDCGEIFEQLMPAEEEEYEDASDVI